MRIGLIGAMPEEVDFIKDEMISKKRHIIATREFISGKLYDVDTVLAFSRWGKVASSITVTNLIDHFDVDLVIFTGVAGAIANEINIGDIVIAQALYQHDMDGRPFFKKHQIPLTDDIFFYADSNLVKEAVRASNKFICNIKNIIDKKF